MRFCQMPKNAPLTTSMVMQVLTLRQEWGAAVAQPEASPRLLGESSMKFLAAIVAVGARISIAVPICAITLK